MGRFEELSDTPSEAINMREHPSRNIPDASYQKWGDIAGPMPINQAGADYKWGGDNYAAGGQGSTYNPQGNVNMKARKR